MSEVIAVDVGFCTVKARHPDKRISFPSATGRPETGVAGYTMEGNGLMAVRLGDERFFTPVGQTALQHQRQAVGRRDGSWVLSDTWLRLLACALGQLLDEGTSAIRLVTGLPVDDWPVYHTALRDKLLATPISFQMRGKEPQKVKVEAVKIPSQPFGTLFSLMFDPFGNAIENEYMGMGAIVDIGGHTTNILTVDRLTTVQDMSGSRPLGLLHALDVIAREINLRYPRLEFTAHDAAVALESGKFNVSGQEIQIDDFADHHLTEFCQAIVQYINDTLARADRLQWLVLSGGGVHAIGGKLQRMLQDEFNVSLASEPRWANVNGYLAIARRATKTNTW